MSRFPRWLLTVIGIALLVFGLGCLNYTKAGGLEHHKQFAAEHGLPPPSEAILLGGVLSLIAGSALLGYTVGPRASLTAKPK